jgi:DNA repair protein RadC
MTLKGHKTMREVPLLITEVRRRNPSHGAPRYKISLVREPGSVYVTSRPIQTARDAFNVGKRLMEDADRELFFMLCLDSARKIIGVNLVSSGNLTTTLVHPREAFKAAILLNAANVIFMHNHPSDSSMASAADSGLTRRLVFAGVLLGIEVRDHIVCGLDTYFSFEEAGLIDAYTFAAKKAIS